MDNNGITTTDYLTPLVSVGTGISTDLTAGTLTDSTRRMKDGNGTIDEGRVKREDGRVRRDDGREAKGE